MKNYLYNKFPKGFCGYAPMYALLHPWLMVAEFFRQCKWAWQRVFRGWDDRVIWSIDSYLAEKIPAWISELKGNIGVSTMFFDGLPNDATGNYSDEEHNLARNKQDEVYQKIIDGFKAYSRMSDEVIAEYNKPELYKELMTKYNDGFDLFKKYFGTLWD
jgi:hypothetical protein